MTRPIIVASNAWVENFIRPIVPECQIPPIWKTDDPLRVLRKEARNARIAVSVGGFAFTSAMVDALPALEFIQIVGAGYDGLDTEALSRRDIRFATTGPVGSADVADYAVAMALAARRGVIDGDAWVRNGFWCTRGGASVHRSFSAERAGIVGMGTIGRDISRRLSGFGLEVRWWGPRPKPSEPLVRSGTLADLASWATLLFVACPSSRETEKLIDRRILTALGPDGLLVSIARGAVTDEDALIELLKGGGLGAAALDVFSPEPTSPERWKDVPNALLSPHRAGVTVESMAARRSVVAENIQRFFAGDVPRYIQT